MWVSPSGGFVNGYGAIVVGVVDSTIVWMCDPLPQPGAAFRTCRRYLGVIFTHGIAGLAGGLLVGLLADPAVVEYIGVGGAANLPGKSSLLMGGSWTLLRWQAETAAWVILYTRWRRS